LGDSNDALYFEMVRVLASFLDLDYNWERKLYLVHKSNKLIWCLLGSLHSIIFHPQFVNDISVLHILSV